MDARFQETEAGSRDQTVYVQTSQTVNHEVVCVVNDPTIGDHAFVVNVASKVLADWLLVISAASVQSNRMSAHHHSDICQVVTASAYLQLLHFIKNND